MTHRMAETIFESLQFLSSLLNARAKLNIPRTSKRGLVNAPKPWKIARLGRLHGDRFDYVRPARYKMKGGPQSGEGGK